MTHWRFRKLRTNEGVYVPRNMLFVDCETIPVLHPDNARKRTHKLRLWCGTHISVGRYQVAKRTTCGGPDAETFASFLFAASRNNAPLHVFAHNLAFDFTLLDGWGLIDRGKLTLNRPKKWRGSDEPTGQAAIVDNSKIGCLVLSDPPTIIETWVKGTRKRIIFLDTLNWWRCSLSKVGEELGLPKLPMPDFAESDLVWKHYCARDVDIIEKAMLEWISMIKTYDMGNFKYTVSSQSLACFKHRFYSGNIVLHRIKDVVKLERDSYFGGDVRIAYCGHISDDEREFFRPNSKRERIARKGPVYILDINSFYPSVMRGKAYPIRLKYHMVMPSRRDVETACKDGVVIARCSLETWERAYPVRHDGHRLMALGKFVTTLCHPEFSTAYGYGDVRNVGRIAVYDYDCIFNDYVDSLYANKLQCKIDGQTAKEQIWKMLLNSLPGKFGQRGHEWLSSCEYSSPNPYGLFYPLSEGETLPQVCRAIDWNVQSQVRDEDRGEGEESFCAIAAFVTSYGRERMREIRKFLPKESFLYQDTDSLHVTEEGYKILDAQGLICKDELGKLSIREVMRFGEYRGIKNYTINGRDVVAGVKADSKRLDDGSYEVESFQTLQSIISTTPQPGIVSRVDRVVVRSTVPDALIDRNGNVGYHILGGCRDDGSRLYRG